MREGRDIAPTHVQLIISDLCNQNCHFCAYRMDTGFSSEKFADEHGNKNPVRFIPTEKCREILDDCAAIGVKALEFTGGGEPTVHKDCYDIIGYAQELGLKTGLVTNGVRIKEHQCLEKLTWLRVSLDAAKASTYKFIRESGAFEKVIRNLEYLSKLKGPYLGIGFVITRENYKEIYDACFMAKNIGIPYIRLSAMFSSNGSDYYYGLEEEINEQRERAKILQSDSFNIVDFFGNRIEDLKQARPDYEFCGYQQFVVYIGGNQKVYTCCTNAYTTHGEIGDLRDQSFCDWWASTSRYGFNARSCHHCQFNDKNKVINYLISPEPAHIDFV